jgi:hypothetical protein
MVKYICEICKKEFFHEDDALNHEKIPITGGEYDKLTFVNSETGKYNIFLKFGLSENHEIKYGCVELTLNGTIKKKILETDYSINKINEEIICEKLKPLTKKEFNELEEKLKKMNPVNHESITLFWEKFEHLASI